MWVIYRHILLADCLHYGWSYIGLTKQKITKRWKNGYGYIRETTNNFFENVILKYGWDAFEHIVIEDNIETLEEAKQREKYWIKYYRTYVGWPDCKGFNLTTGGDNCNWKVSIIKEDLNDTKIILASELAEYEQNGWRIMTKEEKRLRKNQQSKEWRAKNKEHNKQIKKDWYEANKEDVLNKRHQYHKLHPKKYSAEDYQQHKTEYYARFKKYYEKKIKK